MITVMETDRQTKRYSKMSGTEYFKDLPSFDK